TDERPIGFVLSRNGRQRVDIRRRDREARRKLGDARIAGGRKNLCSGIFQSQAPGERVLAPAAAYEENLHRLRQAEVTESRALRRLSLTGFTVSRFFCP